MEIPKGDWSSWIVTCLKLNIKDQDTISVQTNLHQNTETEWTDNCAT